MRHLAALMALAVASTACTGAASDSTPAAPPEPTASAPALETSTTIERAIEPVIELGRAPLVMPPTDTGVAGPSSYIDPDVARASWPIPEVSEDGMSLVLDACRIRYPGQWAFDLTLDAPDSTEFPITLGLSFGWGFGDTGTGTPPIEITASSEGTLTATYDSARYAEPLIPGLDVELRRPLADWILDQLDRQDTIEWTGAECRADIEHSPDAAVTHPFLGDVEVVADLERPVVTAQEGTLQHLAQTADLEASSGAARAWAHLHGHGWSPAADTVWLDPERTPRSIQERWTFGGRCYTLITSYGGDDLPSVTIWQYQDCTTRRVTPTESSATISLEPWTIEVSSEDPDAVLPALEKLIALRNANPLPEPAPRGSTIGEIDLDGTPIFLVRVEYDNGHEQILLESTHIELDGPFAGSNYETWRGCWQTSVYRPGVALILIGDPRWAVALDESPLPLVDIDGIGVAVIPWTDSSPPRPEIDFPDGEACE